MSAADAKHDMYDPRKLDAMYHNLLSRQQAGNPQEFEIRVDDFPVVGKNSDPSRFMEYGEFITPETKHITVLLFRTNRQSDKFFFHLQPGSFKHAQELSGFNHAQLSPPVSESELTEKIKKDLHYEQVIKENAELKQELEEYRAMLGNAEKELEAERAGKKLSFGRIGAYLVDGLAASEFVKEKFPALKNFGGFGNTPEPPKEDGEASFRRKGQTEEADAEEEIYISDKERKYLELIKDIRERFGDAELSNVMHLLDLVSDSPKCVIYAIKMVTSYRNQKPSENQNSPNEKI